MKAKDVYNIEHWSEGFFDVNKAGEVVLSHGQLSLNRISQELEEQGLNLPVLVRFPNILHDRVKQLNSAFGQAINTQGYQGGFTSVYPIKVNQQRRVVEELVAGQIKQGQAIGLEAGSKPELMAVLSMAGSMCAAEQEKQRQQAVIVCNGYKDSHYIRLALLGEKLGHKVYLVVEKLSELDEILSIAQQLNVKPRLGIRARLSSIGKGNWQNTGGEKSKFGLNAQQILNVVNRLKELNALDSFQLLHFHLGSQIANIRDIQTGLSECARIFSELSNIGCDIDVLDVGGGLGVDYEGTRSRSFCSMNYSMEEYASNVVHVFRTTCEQHSLKQPDIITESGRALTAHHAVLLSNVIDTEKVTSEPLIKPAQDDELLVAHLYSVYEQLKQGKGRSLLETYHDVLHDLADGQNGFIHGGLSLAQRAKIEAYAMAIYQHLQQQLNQSVALSKAHREVLDQLNEKLADKLFVNFSLFQSLPDVWGIDQIFPILPLTQLNSEVGCRAVIQDITCDSDGRIEKYVDGEGIETTLPMPAYENHEDILLGFFMVGAYQEILGDMHNLFGDTHSVDVYLGDDGQALYKHAQKGDDVSSVLQYVNFDEKKLRQSYENSISQSTLSEPEKALFLQELTDSLSAYTYLKD